MKIQPGRFYGTRKGDAIYGHAEPCTEPSKKPFHKWTLTLAQGSVSRYPPKDSFSEDGKHGDYYLLPLSWNNITTNDLVHEYIQDDSGNWVKVLQLPKDPP